MPKMLLYGEPARLALAKGVEKLAKAIETTLGPRGGNAVIDRPQGTPVVSRDGASIADEIELEDRFENMGAQIVREVAKETNNVAGDGTTTAILLANALIQEGLTAFDGATNVVAVLDGIDQAVEAAMQRLRKLSRPVTTQEQILSVATIAANDPALGRVVAEGLERVGHEGIVNIEPGHSLKTELEFVEGISFERGYRSAHMANEIERMEAVLESALVLVTDHALLDAEKFGIIENISKDAGKPVLLIAEEISAEVLAALLALRNSGSPLMVAVHPPEFGHWRKAVLEDIATLTGGRFVSKDLGARLEDLQLEDFGTARKVRVSLETTTIVGGGGDPAKIRGRHAQIQRQLEVMEQPVERDKLAERLARMSGGVAVIRVGGATPAEQKRRSQLIEDSLSAVRAALQDGVLSGGGTALAYVSKDLGAAGKPSADGFTTGVRIVQRALLEPMRCIARNSGVNPDQVVDRVLQSDYGFGLNARLGQFEDLPAAGILDPFKVTATSLRNAASVAKLVLATRTLIADKPESYDPTSGPCRGGGAERYGMDYTAHEPG